MEAPGRIRRRRVGAGLAALALAAAGAVLPVQSVVTGSLTTGAGVAHAAICEPDVDPNCPPPTPPPPPCVPGDPSCPLPPPCTGDVGPVHAWPCPVPSTVQCAEAAVGTRGCPTVHVAVASVQAGPVTTPAYDTGPKTVSPPNVYGTAWKQVDCAWQLRACLIKPGADDSPQP